MSLGQPVSAKMYSLHKMYVLLYNTLYQYLCVGVCMYLCTIINTHTPYIYMQCYICVYHALLNSLFLGNKQTKIGVYSNWFKYLLLVYLVFVDTWKKPNRTLTNYFFRMVNLKFLDRCQSLLVVFEHREVNWAIFVLYLLSLTLYLKMKYKIAA